MKFIFSKETLRVTCCEITGKNKSVLVLVKPSFDMLQIKAKAKCFQELHTVVSCGNNVLPHLLCVQLHPQASGTVSKGQNSHCGEKKEKMEGKGKRKEKKN